MSQVELFDFTPDCPPLVVLDTTVLLLYLTGLTDQDAIKKFKRTRQFSRKDFQLLTEILEPFRKIVTTPNVLTETSNLTNHAPDYLRKELRAVMGHLIPSLSERYVPSDRLHGRDAFVRLGLTDVAITDLAVSQEPEVLVLTTDPGLYEYVTDHDTPAVNFTHVMAAHWK